MANFSFPQQGATPQQPSVFGSTGGSTTPVSKALSNTQGFSLASAGNPTGARLISGGQFPTQPAQMVNNLQPPKADTALKSQTQTNVDGSSTKYDYHAPESPGLVNPNSGFQQNIQGSQGTSVQQLGTFPGLLSTVAQQGSQQSPVTQQGLMQSSKAFGQGQDYVQQLKDLQVEEANALQRVSGGPMTLGMVTGAQKALTDAYTRKEQAIGSAIQGSSAFYSPGLSAATTGQGQQFGAAQNAASLAQPQLGQIGSQQYYNPLNAGGGGGGTLPPQAMDFVNSLAQQVRSGQMTRPDAESRLSTYGITGVQALNAALGEGFNTNASNASAQTTGIGQQIQAAIGPANQALDALQIAFSNLPGLQQTGIPILNQFTQNTAMATGIGRDQASAFQGALQEARSRIDAALVGSIGVNAAAAQASALLPDNMIPSEIPNKIAAAKQYLQNQLSSYTASGQQPTPQLGNGMNTNLTWDNI